MITRYTFRPGIAALLDVRAACVDRAPHVVDYSLIYMAPDKPLEAYRGHDMRRNVAAELPHSVLAVADAHFRAVFALPVEQREAYLKTRAKILPLEVHHD